MSLGSAPGIRRAAGNGSFPTAIIVS